MSSNAVPPALLLSTVGLFNEGKPSALNILFAPLNTLLLDNNGLIIGVISMPFSKASAYNGAACSDLRLIISSCKDKNDCLAPVTNSSTSLPVCPATSSLTPCNKRSRCWALRLSTKSSPCCLTLPGLFIVALAVCLKTSAVSAIVASGPSFFILEITSLG